MLRAVQELVTVQHGLLYEIMNGWGYQTNRQLGGLFVRCCELQLCHKAMPGIVKNNGALDDQPRFDRFILVREH